MTPEEELKRLEPLIGEWSARDVSVDAPGGKRGAEQADP
jgi:hypothetical protein